MYGTFRRINWQSRKLGIYMFCQGLPLVFSIMWWVLNQWRLRVFIHHQLSMTSFGVFTWTIMWILLLNLYSWEHPQIICQLYLILILLPTPSTLTNKVLCKYVPLYPKTGVGSISSPESLIPWKQKQSFDTVREDRSWLPYLLQPTGWGV